MSSHRRARELFRYDPKTGALTRKITRGRWKAGEQAGTVRTRVDATINFEGRDISLARFIYWFKTGKLPPAHVDHRNGDPTDFRWKNLRAATPSQNTINQRPRPNSTGYPGVKLHHGKYAATITSEQWVYRLGTFETAKEAGKAYQDAKAILHGEWSRSSRRAKAGLLSYVSRRPVKSRENRAARQANAQNLASRREDQKASGTRQGG